MKKKLLSILVPAYNEQDVIDNSMKLIDKTMKSLKHPYEILVVDDGSKDATPKILEKLIKNKKISHLKVIRYDDGPSRRENLAKSFKLLKGDYILLLDSDLSMDLKHVKEMIYWLDQGFDLVIPNRYHRESKIKRVLKRYVISKIYNGIIRLLFQTGFQDNICGFKGFQKNTAKMLVADAGIDKTRKRSVFWDTELLIRAKKRKIRIKEIPIEWVEGKNSALTINREMSMIPYIFKLWLKLKL